MQHVVFRRDKYVPGAVRIKGTLVDTVLVVLSLGEASDHRASGVGTALNVVPCPIYAFVNLSVT